MHGTSVQQKQPAILREIASSRTGAGNVPEKLEHLVVKWGGRTKAQPLMGVSQLEVLPVAKAGIIQARK